MPPARTLQGLGAVCIRGEPELPWIPLAAILIKAVKAENMKRLAKGGGRQN